MSKCNETRHLIIRAPINVFGQKGLGKVSVKQKEGKSVMTGIESSRYGKGVDSRLFIPAHMVYDEHIHGLMWFKELLILELSLFKNDPLMYLDMICILEGTL